jgi:hypothetical protein
LSGEQNFWSRRRAGVAAEAEAEQAALEAQSLAAEHAALDEKTDAEILAELDLPEPETLQSGDDFTAFLAKAVPDRIRRRALKVLWRSNPVLANVDMLVDYGEDFTDSATVIENLQTTYQVGKGMLKHVQEMARQAEAEAALAEAPEVDEEPPEEVALADMADAADEPTAEQSQDITDIEDEAPEAYAAIQPRRMKFTVEEPA